jgi:DNA-binding transcriptional LysR family regulator
MTLEDLRCLVAVHECKSFSEAARRLARTQPAVSQHIQRLESELGLQLFERQPRGVSLTAAGELMLRAAREALGALERAAHQFASLRDGESGTLTLATGGTTVHHFMRGAIAALRRSLPRVRLQLRGAASSAECIDALFRESVDLAFVTTGDAIDGVSQIPVLELEYVLLTGRDHPLARRKRLKLEDLHGLECIDLIEGRTSRSQLAGALAREGVALEAAMCVYDWDTAIQLVELGLGSAVVPSWHAAASTARAELAAIPIAGLPPIRVGWAMRASYQPLKPARELMRLLRADLRSKSAQQQQQGVRVVR